MAAPHDHDPAADLFAARESLRGKLSRTIAELLRGNGRCQEQLQAFTMLLPNGQLAVSCCQRLAELIGYGAASEERSVEACSS